MSHPPLYAILSLNPFAVLINAYRAVTYGTRRRRTGSASGSSSCSRSGSSLAAIYVFKRAEPAFARIL